MPLASLMDASLKLGRSLHGARMAAKRWRASDDDNKKADAAVLTSYIKKCVIAESLQAKAIGTLPADELAAGLHSMLEEKVDFPECVQRALVRRKVKELMASRHESELLDVIQPWGDGEFDPLQPRLCHCAQQASQKIQDFSQVVITEYLVPLVMEGETSKDRVIKFTDLRLQHFENVDIMDFDNIAASAWREWVDGWKALRALCRPTLEDFLQYQDRCVSNL